MACTYLLCTVIWNRINNKYLYYSNKGINQQCISFENVYTWQTRTRVIFSPNRVQSCPDLFFILVASVHLVGDAVVLEQFATV